MADGMFSGPLATLLHKALDASSLHHKVIANNLANVDTPGFKRSQVDFRNRLSEAMAARQQGSHKLKAFTTNSKHIDFTAVPDISQVEASIETDRSSAVRNDGNNVDIDREMSFLTENTLMYNTLAQVVNSRLDGLRYAISEGRR